MAKTTILHRTILTYQVTEAGFGVLLLGSRAVRLRVQEEGAHGTLGLVGVLDQAGKANIKVRTHSIQSLRGLSFLLTFIQPHLPLLGALTSRLDLLLLLLFFLFLLLSVEVLLVVVRRHGSKVIDSFYSSGLSTSCARAIEREKKPRPLAISRGAGRGEPDFESLAVDFCTITRRNARRRNFSHGLLITFPRVFFNLEIQSVKKGSFRYSSSLYMLHDFRNPNQKQTVSCVITTSSLSSSELREAFCVPTARSQNIPPAQVYCDDGDPFAG